VEVWSTGGARLLMNGLSVNWLSVNLSVLEEQ
jgi:hypothetical protein